MGACGAAVGAYKAASMANVPKVVVEDLKEDIKDSSVPNVLELPYDTQIEFLIAQMRPLLAGVDDSQDKMAFVSYQTYTIARDLLLSVLRSNSDTYDWCTELAIVGGIMINRARGGDHFQPLMFESKSKDGTVTDLFQQSFGKRPDLAKVLGSDATAQQVLSAPKW